MTIPARLNRLFYGQDTVSVAKQLLGKTLVRRFISGGVACLSIVEVEAYLPTGDAASHSFGGKKNMNASMFLAPGRLYVYPIHSRHCLNVVTEPAGIGAAVLIRAAEPLNQLEELGQRRGLDAAQLQQLAARRRSAAVNLTRGPGRLCEALEVDRKLNSINLLDNSDLWLAETHPMISDRDWQIRSGPRIGISQATDLGLRFFVDGNHFVSGTAACHSQGRQHTFANWMTR